MIELNILTLSVISNSVFMRLKGNEHLFSSYEKFVELTQFPFSNEVINLSYEPERDIYVVETLDRSNPSGLDNIYIQWVIDNIDNIIDAAAKDKPDNLYVISLRDARNAKLYETEWMVVRHKEQLDIGVNTSLTTQQYNNLLTYRQQLRDITKQYSNLDDVIWPLFDI
jgi:hypothetical protein